MRNLNKKFNDSLQDSIWDYFRDSINNNLGLELNDSRLWDSMYDSLGLGLVVEVDRLALNNVSHKTLAL